MCNSIHSIGIEEFIVTILATLAVCLKFFIVKIKKKKIWDKVLRRKEEKGNIHPVSTGFMPSISLPSFTWVIFLMHLEKLTWDILTLKVIRNSNFKQASCILPDNPTSSAYLVSGGAKIHTHMGQTSKLMCFNLDGYSTNKRFLEAVSC